MGRKDKGAASVIVSQKLPITCSVLVAILIFIWHVPEVIAARYIVMLGAFFCFASFARKANYEYLTDKLYRLRFVLILLSLFVVWGYFNAIFISNEHLWALKELNGQVLTSYLLFLFGFSMSAIFMRDSADFAKRLLSFIFFAYMVHVLYVDLFSMRYFVEFKSIPIRIAGLTKGADEVSYLMSTFSAFIAAEFFFRFVLKKRILPVDNSIYLAILFAFVFALIVQAKRNGMISASFLIFSLFFLWLYEKRSQVSVYKMMISSTVAIAIVALIGVVSYKTDSRWEAFGQTFKIALDTNTNKAWLNWDKYPRPLLSNGEQVNHSNYMRPAWIKEGSILIIENPLGVGYGRNAFGHALKAKYGEGGGHSHSGIIDLGIGLGIPGIFIWYLFLSFLAIFGLRAHMQHKSYAGLLLFFITVGFGSRMLIDSLNRDHMLEQFMFLVGLLYALADSDSNRIKSSVS